MPIYQYICPKHGAFEELQSVHKTGARCPECGRKGEKIVALPAKSYVHHHNQNLPYGSGSRGRYVPASETGGLPLLVPSWGAMEKEEVDWVTENAIYREKERVAKKQRERPASVVIGGLMNQALKQPEGKRRDVIEKALKEA